MIVRTNIGVAIKYNKLNKIYSISEDGGASWSKLEVFADIKEPICMTSIVNTGDALYYSQPDDYYFKVQMTIAVSRDDGATFDNRKIIYQGASGYSDLGVSYEGDLFLVFENGAVEYDGRITFVRVKAFGD